MPVYYKWEGDDLLLNLYVQPNAKSDELVGEYSDKLKVRITAPSVAVDNKANKYLLKFLAKTYAVSVSKVTLVKGESQRTKQVKILTPKKLPELIKEIKTSII